ncbi:glutamate synthase subunit beta [Candidatus Omnitrophus magneticus]|uniref:Glutamate synthase subunit beta n=1 Tax=Candidatus Omnitrophus magneticus TaxID=1609969 RepID=A0A0F0CT02_9BACT|nr:glutamate synthase subunit beta [Candidatus Omnitrophus magneticus]
MAKDLKGFLKIKRVSSKYRPVNERIKDFSDVVCPKTDLEAKEQSTRCMDCGTPFCHWACPVSNNIPEWNEYLSQGQWGKAFDILSATNNLPEMTGRVCPALCEYSCVLGINDDPVTIRENELAIVEHEFETGYVKPIKPEKITGKKVAVIGSGPSALACADELNKKGHKVIVFEKAEKIGDSLRYGIPDFKLEKWIIDRRVKIMEESGIVFKTGVNVGVNYETSKLLKDFDAVCLAGGSRLPRDLNIDGRDAKGIYFAVDYLTQANKKSSGEIVKEKEIIAANGKKVIVIGGGDTGADCVGTANREGALSVTQIEIMPRPAECRTSDYPWPKYPMLLKTSSSHEEGARRMWAILTKRFVADNKGVLKKLVCLEVVFEKGAPNTCPIMKEVAGSEFEIESDLVVLALGFLHPEHDALLTKLGVEFDKRGNVKADAKYKTSVAKVFSAGDMHRGQSLIVWAINEGRETARAIDEYLQ